MANPRLIVVFLVLAGVGLVAAQNIAPALPLVFLGLRTAAYPLGLWLVVALGLGSLTSLGLNRLIAVDPAPASRPRRSGRRVSPEPNARSAAGPNVSAQTRTAAASAAGADPGGEWGEWTQLDSPSQWSDWSQAERPPAARPRPSAGGAPPAASWAFWRRPDPSQQVEQSMEELADGWGDLEDARYRARGVSPVEDALDELEEGWDSAPARQDFEVSQAPKRIYRDGSIYSYSYQDEAAPQGRVDDIYGPADDQTDWDETESDYGPDYSPDYGADAVDGATAAPGELQDPRLAADGVVDADYRVLIPPYRPLDPSTGSTTDDDLAEDLDDDDDWIDGPPQPPQR
jgi:hypothetical protein